MKLFKWLKKKHELAQGIVYACEHGTYCGQFFMFMETEGDNHLFLTLPKLKIVTVSKTHFKDGVDKKVLNYAYSVPKYVLEICKAQFAKERLNEVSNNRHQQPPVPDLSHSEMRQQRSRRSDRKEQPKQAGRVRDIVD